MLEKGVKNAVFPKKIACGEHPPAESSASGAVISTAMRASTDIQPPKIFLLDPPMNTIAVDSATHRYSLRSSFAPSSWDPLSAMFRGSVTLKKCFARPA